MATLDQLYKRLIPKTDVSINPPLKRGNYEIEKNFERI